MGEASSLAQELHVAEQPGFITPMVSAVQGWLRANGQPLFDFLAKPDTVKQILKEIKVGSVFQTVLEFGSVLWFWCCKILKETEFG